VLMRGAGICYAKRESEGRKMGRIFPAHAKGQCWKLNAKRHAPCGATINEKAVH